MGMVSKFFVFISDFVMCMLTVVYVVGQEVNTVNWLRMNVCTCIILLLLYVVLNTGCILVC